MYDVGKETWASVEVSYNSDQQGPAISTRKASLFPATLHTFIMGTSIPRPPNARLCRCTPQPRASKYLEWRVGVKERHDDDGHDGEHEDGEDEAERPDVNVEVLATKLDDLQNAAQSRDADDDRQQHALHLLVGKTDRGGNQRNTVLRMAFDDKTRMPSNERVACRLYGEIERKPHSLPFRRRHNKKQTETDCTLRAVLCKTSAKVLTAHLVREKQAKGLLVESVFSFHHEGGIKSEGQPNHTLRGA